MAVVAPVYGPNQGPVGTKNIASGGPTGGYSPLYGTITWPTMATTDTGDVADISLFEGVSIQVIGTGTAQLQRSNDGTNWVNWGSALAANSMNDQALQSARFVKISAVATASVVVILSGRRKRP